MRPFLRALWAGLLPVCGLFVLFGCLPEDAGNTDYFAEWVMASALRPPGAPVETFPESESNDEFGTANLVYWEQAVEMTGDIEPDAEDFDRDVFDLGPLEAGQRLQITLTIDDGDDVVLGLFDDEFDLLGFIDFASWATGPRQIDLVLREWTSRLYVEVATRSANRVPLPYTVNVSRQEGSVLGYRPQIVLLNYHGGSGVRIGNRPPVDVPAFDAAVINEEYAGQTEALIDLILERVREDYAGLDVQFYLDDAADLPPGEYTTIYYGTSDARLLGLADNIDPFNAERNQAAILYTDVFSLFNVFQPNLETMAQVLANVTSHELGHLLGLRHTEDVHCLMDITATASQMLQEQWFSNTRLHASVIPLGNQNAPRLLSWAVGGQLLDPPADKNTYARRAISLPAGVVDFYIDRAQLADHSAE